MGNPTTALTPDVFVAQASKMADHAQTEIAQGRAMVSTVESLAASGQVGQAGQAFAAAAARGRQKVERYATTQEENASKTQAYTHQAEDCQAQTAAAMNAIPE